MVVDKIEIAVATDAEATAAAFERLATAISAASTALDALGDRHPGVNIKICGALATVSIAGAITSAEVADIVQRQIRNGA